MANDSNATFSFACKLKRMSAIAKFIKEAQPSCLDLKGKNIDVEDLKLLVRYLPDSQVTELILERNNLAHGMQELSEVLPKTEITKLNVSNCELTDADLFMVMEVLKDTAITELSTQYLSLDSQLGVEEWNRFLSLMLASRLRIFDFDLIIVDADGDIPFFEVLPRTSITQLKTSQGPAGDHLRSLFPRLDQSSLTDIEVEMNEELMDWDIFKKLSDNLRHSKLEKLTLSSDDVDDCKLDMLVEGLVQSKVVDLNLSANKIRGANTLGVRLKDTHIKKLDLSYNRLDQYAMFVYPDFLRCSSVTDLNVSQCHLNAEHFRRMMECVKFSKVTNLNIACNNLELISISKFAEVLKDTKLEKVDFLGNSFCPEAFIVLSECIKTSKLLSHINISGCLKHPNEENLLPVFLREVKGSSLDFVEFRGNNLNGIGAKMLAPHLINVTFTHLDLSSNKIGNGVISLAERLKFSPLTHLYLSRNEISDEGAEALAKNLQETQLIELKLESNKITSRGAKKMSSYLKNSNILYLDLSFNKIENDGIGALAKGVENTFITLLDVSHNSKPGDGFFLLDAALWENKIAAHYLMSTFKQIMPQSVGDSFRFDENTSNWTVETFLENCLLLNMNILQKPSAGKVLKEDKTVAFNKEEITYLMSEEFPKQFSEFMGSRVVADTAQQVVLLKSAEDKGLSKVVELLLLNRPSYLIDENLGILHPYVYKLLNKYNHPLFNTDVEPDAKTKIISYFTERTDLEGATDVIRLLHGKRKQ